MQLNNLIITIVAVFITVAIGIPGAPWGQPPALGQPTPRSSSVTSQMKPSSIVAFPLLNTTTSTTGRGLTSTAPTTQGTLLSVNITASMSTMPLSSKITASTNTSVSTAILNSNRTSSSTVISKTSTPTSSKSTSSTTKTQIFPPYVSFPSIFVPPTFRISTTTAPSSSCSVVTQTSTVTSTLIPAQSTLTVLSNTTTTTIGPVSTVVVNSTTTSTDIETATVTTIETSYTTLVSTKTLTSSTFSTDEETSTTQIAVTEMTTSYITNTETTTLPTTVATRPGFLGIQDSLPGASLRDPISPAGKRAVNFKINSSAVPFLPAPGPGRPSTAIPTSSCPTTTTVTTATVTASTPTVTTTSVITMTITSTPITTSTAIYTDTLTITTFNTSTSTSTVTVQTTFDVSETDTYTTTVTDITTTLTSTTTSTTVSTVTATATAYLDPVYAACANNNIADLYNGYSIWSVKLLTAKSQHNKNTASAYDCCVHVMTEGQPYEFWEWTSGNNLCRSWVGTAGLDFATCSQSQTDFRVRYVTDPSDQGAWVGNGVCGQFTSAQLN